MPIPECLGRGAQHWGLTSPAYYLPGLFCLQILHPPPQWPRQPSSCLHKRVSPKACSHFLICRHRATASCHPPTHTQTPPCSLPRHGPPGAGPPPRLPGSSHTFAVPLFPLGKVKFHKSWAVDPVYICQCLCIMGSHQWPSSLPSDRRASTAPTHFVNTWQGLQSPWSGWLDLGCLPGPSLSRSSMVVHVYNPSTWKVETGKATIQGHPWII